MKFRKLAAFTAAVMVCAAAFTACSDNSSSGEAETSAAQSQSETGTSAQTEENGGENTTDEENENSGTEEETSGETENQDNSDSILSAAAEAALNGSAWPALERIEDPDFISDFFLLDAGNSNYRDLLVLKCPMSANLSELIIIEADDISSAKADLEERKKKAQEKDAFYPDDVDKANASIVGAEGSFAYYILGSDPESIETALTDYLKSVS